MIAIKYLIFFFYIGLHLVFCKSKPMRLVLTSISQCKDKENLPIYIDRWEIIQKAKNDFHISGHINITQDFPLGFQVNVRLDKCPDDARLGNCDTFMNNFASKSICHVIYATQTNAMSSLLNAIEPKFQCPLKAGVYTITDLAMDETMVEYFPRLGATFWHTVMEGELEKVEVACIEITSSVRPNRSKG